MLIRRKDSVPKTSSFSKCTSAAFCFDLVMSTFHRHPAMLPVCEVIREGGEAQIPESFELYIIAFSFNLTRPNQSAEYPDYPTLPVWFVTREGQIIDTTFDVGVACPLPWRQNEVEFLAMRTLKLGQVVHFQHDGLENSECRASW